MHQSTWNRRKHKRFLLAVVGIILLLGITPAAAQTTSRVQEFQGHLDPGEIDVYRLDGLQTGQVLSVLAETISGNLDPFVGLLAGDTDLAAVEQAYLADLNELLSSNGDIAAGLVELRDLYFLAWDDDSGPGYASAMNTTIPSPGDYYLLVTSNLSAAGRKTQGDYRLQLGLDSAGVTEGTATASGTPFASLDSAQTTSSPVVQEVTGTLSADQHIQSYLLNSFKPGSTIYVYVETTSGDLKPAILLRDYGKKPLAASNLAGKAASTSLSYTLEENSLSYQLDIGSAPQDAQVSESSYRLLVGVDAPDVLQGNAPAQGRAIFQAPIPVQVGVKLEQIVAVDQHDEFFNAVGSLRMDWSDPALAFSPDTCRCQRKLYSEAEFSKFLNDVQGRWPDFSFYNQQGNRWIQNRAVVVNADGSASYFERFTTNFQVDFNYDKFPFDTQDFYIQTDMLYPDSRYTFIDLPGYSGFGPQLGEDEFIITDFTTQSTPVVSSTGSQISRFTFEFSAPRHLSYYIFRLFVPILLIMIISWVTFFLKDYTRRIEVAAGNVLLFIAFSFSLADNYPRLGYLTFLDAVMAVTFIVNTAVVVYNVYLKKLESNDEAEKADRIDSILDWAYPLMFIALIGICVWVYFG
jgi:hypothetical protein